MLRLQLGALFAAGMHPDSVMDMTWPQIRQVSIAIRQYHTDVAVSLWTGKSPTAQAAKRWMAQQQARQMLEYDLRRTRPDVAPADMRVIIDEAQKLDRISKLGFRINILQPDQASDIPDLFQVAEGLKRDRSVPKAPPGPAR